jgi:hypothetical protein
MFRENTEHLQGSIFGTIDVLLGESQKKAYLESRERWFYELIFKRIDEKAFASLELHSRSLQSPDDEDATYRKKRGVSYRGQILTATETCNPENEL